MRFSHRKREKIRSFPLKLPNKALEPTPTASARASLWLLARLTASVRWPARRVVGGGRAHQRGCGRVAHAARNPCWAPEAGGAPPGALGAGARARAGRPPPTEQRSGADGPQRASVVSVGWSTVARRSPPALGPWRASREGVVPD